MLVGLAVAMFVVLFGWGATYFGWHDPHGRVQLALVTSFILGIIGGYKAKASEVAALAAREGVQMHGGIGMTDEHDVGLYMKRAAVLEELFGDVYFHRNRVAELSGY